MMVLLFMCVCLCVFVHDLSMLEMRFVYCGLAFAISDMKWDKAVCVLCNNLAWKQFNSVRHSFIVM